MWVILLDFLKKFLLFWFIYSPLVILCLAVSDSLVAVAIVFAVGKFHSRFLLILRRESIYYVTGDGKNVPFFGFPSFILLEQGTCSMKCLKSISWTSVFSPIVLVQIVETLSRFDLMLVLKYKFHVFNERNWTLVMKNRCLELIVGATVFHHKVCTFVWDIYHSSYKNNISESCNWNVVLSFC